MMIFREHGGQMARRIGALFKVSFAVWEKERYWILTRQRYDSVTMPV